MKRFFSVLLFTFLFTGIFLYVKPQFNTQIRQITSPLPNFLMVNKNSQVTLLDFWLPFIGQAQGSGSNVPNVTAQSVLMFDLTTNKTIYEKDPNQRRPMASLTKIMTAIISLENKRTDDTYVVKQQDLVGQDSMGLSAGEKLSLEDLLYGLILHSGNDAAEVLADNYPNGGRASFIQAMNEKAQALGLTDTHFDNPTGLEGDGVQYSTAYDLLVMTRYALENFPEFAKVSATAAYTIPQTSSHKEYDLSNETNLLTTYPGVQGVKTGYTPQSGLCLITYLNYGGHQIIGIILDSQDRRMEMKDLLDYSLQSVGVTPPQFNG